MEYNEQQMNDLIEIAQETKTKVVDGTIMVPLSTITEVSQMMLYILRAYIEKGQACDVEAYHTLLTVDYLNKVVGAIELKHPDIIPDNIGSLELEE